jgi:hypothetical protein
MDFEINQRGNLIIPAPRAAQRVKAFALAALISYLTWWLNGFDISEWDLSPGVLVGIGVFGIAILFVLSWTGKDLEFDDVHQRVVRGKKTIAKYSDIRHVEIHEGEPDEPDYRVTLQLLGRRRYQLFDTDDEADASLNAATIARAIGKPVVAAFGKRS